MKDNCDDRDTRGRHRTARGTAHKLAKLTDQDVRDIRASFAAGGVTKRDLMRRYGVAESLIYRIIHRKSWAHVP